MLSDFHMHTDFSGDCDIPAQTMIEQAISLSMKQLCITDHYDYDYPDEPELFLIDFDKYFEHPEDSKIIHEKQTQEDKQREFMLLGLRKIEGVKISDFKNKFIDNPIYLYRESLSKLVTQGLIEIDIDSIKLTNRGIDLANLVWEEFV